MPAARRPAAAAAPAKKTTTNRAAAAPKGPKLSEDTELVGEVIVPDNGMFVIAADGSEGAVNVWHLPEGVSGLNDKSIRLVKEGVSLARSLEILTGEVQRATTGQPKPGPKPAVTTKKAAAKAEPDDEAPYGRHPDGTPKQKPGRKPGTTKAVIETRKAPAKKAAAPAKKVAVAKSAAPVKKVAKAPQKAAAASKASGRPSARAKR